MPEPEAVADPDLDIDRPMLDVPEERGIPERPQLDVMELVEGMVPIYNPLPMPFDLPYNGRTFRVRPNGVDLVPIEVADMNVGPDNQGGRLSRFGLRRLYGPEPRFAAAAANRGLTVEELAAKLNEKYRAEADAMAAQAMRLLNAEAEDLEGAVNSDRRR